MEVRVENRADELRHLRNCVNDLVSVTALPALWAGGEPREIVKTLLEALVGMLRLDFVYARVGELVGVPFESVHFAGQVRPEVTPEEIGRALEGMLACDTPAPAVVPNPAGEGEVRVASFSLGLNEGNGRVVAASQRQDFPTDTEALLLRVAANQAAIAMDNARLYELVRRSEQELTDFFENGVVGLHWVGPDGTILRANRAELDMLGYAPEEYVGRNIVEFHADRAAIADILRRLQAGEVLRECPARLRCKDGSVRYVLIDSSVMWEGDRFVHTRCFTRDITERRRAEEALRSSESRLRAMFGQAAVGIVLVDCDGRLLEVNRRFCEILGRQPEELCALTCEDLTHPEDWFCNGPMMREVAEGAREEFAIEKRYARGDGSWVWVKVAVSPLRDAEGRVERLLAVVEDIDARKRAEAERELLLEREKALRARAEEANRLKDEFLATVSHELRTPLTAILGWAQMLEKTPLDSETARHAVGVIGRNADQQRHIVEDILDVSRIITGKLRLEQGPVEVGSLVQAVFDSLGPTAKAKGIRLVSAFDPVAVVKGDEQRLQQVVWNLLSNAVKFTPPGGEVRVGVGRLPSCVRIEVSDTGQGISPEFLPYVFDRFRQADGSRTRAHGGLGLGLSIVRHLVELHGGTVRADSAGEGCGATFTVELPVPTEAERDAGVTEGQAGAVPHTPGRDGPLPPLLGLRVLLVDDNEDTLEMLSMFLRRAGAAEVTATSSAGAALEELGRVRPDVIVADIGMPGVDGYELMRRVRLLGAAQGGYTPAIALTAYASAADRTRAMQAGYQAHLAKPVGPEALVETIVEVAGSAVQREL